jgi:hypothetical protein
MQLDEIAKGMGDNEFDVLDPKLLEENGLG